jgi:CheY-like chemotaxis protein
MGGDIAVQSQVGHGSTFWLTARFANSAGAVDTVLVNVAYPAEQELKAHFAGARILLAEDDPVSVEIARTLMQEAGLHVDHAVDGVEAVEMAKRMNYDLIVMDMQMPKLGGVDAARTIRALPCRERIPIVAMTANAFAADRARCLEAGMNDFVSKPIDPEALFGTLLRWLRTGSV